MRSILGTLAISSLLFTMFGCGGDDSGSMTDGGGLPRDSGMRLDSSVMPPRDGGGGSTDAGPVDPWTRNAMEYRGMNDMTFDYDCPAPGTAGSVWGTDIYSDDSSVCTAAVHAGAITLAAGGTVTIRIRPGQAMYTGSDRNGITSLDWSMMWEGSFEVVP